MRDWSELGYIIDENVWLPPKEFAKLTGVSYKTLYNKKSAGELDEQFLITDGHYWWIHCDMPITWQIRGPKKKRQ